MLAFDRVLLISITAIGCIVFVSCGQKWGEFEKIENPDSPLLTILIKEQDFSLDWYWIAEATHQKQRNPTSENNYVVEDASKSLAGFIAVKVS